MGFFDVVFDMIKPDFIDNSEKVYKLLKLAKNVGKQPAEKDVKAFVGVLKKEWLEEVETQLKHDVKRMDNALKVKLSLPGDKINKLQRKVFATYKKERAEGLEPSKCKATLRVLRDLDREVARSEKELTEYAKSELYAGKISGPIVRNYKARQRMAAALRNALAEMLTNPAYGLFNSEISVYLIHCIDLAKYLRQAEISAKKLGARAMKDGRLAMKRAKILAEELRYVRRTGYLEDLEDRNKFRLLPAF
ncbi:MAG: hypothetical protein JKY31_02535 [Rhodobacteraceae bacterium]|nr:hypothetical protein [Paracoccaceae bacterium]